MSSPGVRTATSYGGRVLTVIIDRPQARNAVDGETAMALFNAFEAFEQNDAQHVAVLYGAGGTFCAGADLKAVTTGTGGNPINAHGRLGPMGPSRMRLSKPVIAAVSGFAVAGGLELACWADLRVVEESATFGVFCRRWGVPLIDGGTVRLPRLVGHSVAMDLILTGRPMQADEAHRVGLANRIVKHGCAREEAEKLASTIAAFPQITMLEDRKSTLEQWNLPEDLALQNEFAHGSACLRQSRKGAAQFAKGAGRSGDFSLFESSTAQPKDGSGSSKL